MLILPISDMHIEHTNYVLPPGSPCNVIVVAGDVADGFHKAAPWLVNLAYNNPDKEVLFVLGNHCLASLAFTLKESYAAYAALTDNCPNLHLLSSGVCHPVLNYVDEKAKVAFIGDTLWTDFSANNNHESDMRYAQGSMIDYGWIRTNPVTIITPAVTFEMHEEMKIALFEQARHYKSLGYKVVMVSHHGPHPISQNTKFTGEPSCAAYCSNVIPDSGSPYIDLAIHGHIHQFKEYFLGNTHVVHNPVCSGVPYPHKMTVEV